MEEPPNTEAWEGINRPTSAPPVMELTQQLNAADLAHQGYGPLDSAYFASVGSDAVHDAALFGDGSANHAQIYMVRSQSDSSPLSTFLMCCKTFNTPQSRHSHFVAREWSVFWYRATCFTPSERSNFGNFTC